MGETGHYKRTFKWNNGVSCDFELNTQTLLVKKSITLVPEHVPIVEKTIGKDKKLVVCAFYFNRIDKTQLI